MAARLESQFGGVPGVRVVPDARTSQVLVMAPHEVHAQIDRGIAPAQAPPAVPPRASPPSVPSSPPSQATSTQASLSEQVPLRYSTGERIEHMLLDMLGERIEPAGSSIPNVAAYRVRLPAGGMLLLSIDRGAHRVMIEGPAAAVGSCAQLIRIADSCKDSPNDVTRLVSLKAARRTAVQRTVEAIRGSNAAGLPQPRAGATRRRGDGSLVTMLYQQAGQGPADRPDAPDAQTPQAGSAPPEVPEEAGGLIGPVQIEMLEGLNTLVIRGHERDVQMVLDMIEQIEQLSAITEPAIEVCHLQHVNCEALAELVTQLYADVFELRRGSVSITALVKPNALLLIGQPETVETVLSLVKRLDRPVAPNTQFQVFRLRHAPAQTAQEMIEGFYEERGGLGTRLLVTADFRSNSLIVQASPRDLQEVAEMIARIDVADSEVENELQVFQLQNSLAEEMAEILQDAISGAATGDEEERSTTLRLITVDKQGRQQFSSGILTSVRITPDARANTLLVSAPADSMPLIEALIRQLDQLPAAEAQIKVFTILNGDASSLMDMLEYLFGETTAVGEPAIQTGAAEGESTLVPLRFAVDVRTNSIIASGSLGDLSVVEAILLRLDETDVRIRQSTVYRLKNAPATDVADAINEYLSNEREVVQVTTDLMSPFEQIEREVVVVAEPVSNSLIVSATPEYFEEIRRLVEDLDARPPMVMIQVLIAEVKLNDTDEFGVELGLQDSLLFDRSLLENIDRTTKTTQTSTPSGIVTVTEQIIESADITPGFLFNNQTLGNSGSNKSLATAPFVASQGLSHFDLGRVNNELGYGGLVLSASSEAVNILIRALNESRRLEILSRPQIMTLDNQPAFILVGERVPRVTGTQTNEAGQTNTIALEDVGLILGVTPRISPDGLVVMEIDAQKSELGTEAEGIPISIAPNGDTIRSPRITTTQAQTTVSAVDGQTVILGGLITKSKNEVRRRVPLLADIPVVGNLFRYDLEEEERRELLIIMTPHIIENEEDAEVIKQVEAARMHWCLNDVVELMGDAGFRDRYDEWYDSETTVIYPDMEATPGATPAPKGAPEPVPTPRETSQPLLPPDETPFFVEPQSPTDEGAMNVPRPLSQDARQTIYRAHHERYRQLPTRAGSRSMSAPPPSSYDASVRRLPGVSNTSENRPAGNSLVR